MQRGKSFQRENTPGGESSKVDRRENHQEGNCDKFYVRDIIPEGSYDKSFEGENVLVDFIHRGRKCQGGECARGDNVCQPLGVVRIFMKETLVFNEKTAAIS